MRRATKRSTHVSAASQEPSLGPSVEVIMVTGVTLVMEVCSQVREVCSQVEFQSQVEVYSQIKGTEAGLVKGTEAGLVTGTAAVGMGARRAGTGAARQGTQGSITAVKVEEVTKNPDAVPPYVPTVLRVPGLDPLGTVATTTAVAVPISAAMTRVLKTVCASQPSLSMVDLNNIRLHYLPPSLLSLLSISSLHAIGSSVCQVRSSFSIFNS